MSDLLFASPWWIWGTLLVIGAIVAWTGIQRQQKNSTYSGVGLILLAVALKVISFVMVTDKEKCEQQSRELVSSVEKRDWVMFTSLLDDDVSLGTTETTLFANRKLLVDGAKKDTALYDPKNFGVHLGNVEQDATGVTVDIDVSAESATAMNMRVPTGWKLIWQKSGSDWKLHRIICTKLMNSTGNQMAHEIAG